MMNFKIAEESSPNTYIGSLEQNDCGKPAHFSDGRNVNYRLVSENTVFLSNIDIDRHSGKMTLRHSIDRDTMCEKMKLCCGKLVDGTSIVECTVQLKAVVELIDTDGSPQSTVYCNVNVEVTDINDNSPLFSPDKVIINISEAAVIDFSIPLPVASDADSSRFTVTRYYLKDSSRYFRVESNQDSAGLLVPKLIIKSRLDRELISEHQLTLIAIDSGLPAKSGSLNVIVRIVDENDNEPIIEPINAISLRENVPVGHFITRIQAHDKDSGDNAMMSYEMKEQSSRTDVTHFRINQMTGEITLARKVDYDAMHLSPQIELTITVKDHGKPKPLTSSTTVTVLVVDVNDEVPKISVIDLYSRQPARPEIRENLVHNQFVAFVNVRDDDHGINGQIKCSLLGEHSDFSLETIEHNSPKDRYEFKIVTKTRLDCERQSLYKVLISCYDLGHPKQSSQEELIVKVVDINDNSPTFGSPKIEVDLEENQSPGTLVTTLTVTDLDETDKSNGQFEYSLNDNGRRFFRIEPIDGRGRHLSAKLRIYTLQSFDREKIANVEFEVTVKDVNWGSGVGLWQSLSSTSTIVVNIVDTNDNAPVFSKSQYEFSISEEKPNGQFVGLIQAVDEDQGNNGKIVYKIDDYSNSFFLDPNTGSMVTKTKLDREKNSVFEFKVRASDLGRPSRSNSVNVVVRVNDVNDNDPKFIYPTSENHTVLVSVYNTEGSLIMKVNAIDNDETGKNLVTYNIESGDDTSLFQIDPGHGGISFARKPKITEAKSYFITIKVSDNDYPTRSSKITIHLKLDETRQPFYGQDHRRATNPGEPDDLTWTENSSRNKFPLNRNILLVICLIVISVTLAGVLLMLIMCLKRRPQSPVAKAIAQQNYQEQSKNKMFATYKGDTGNVCNTTLNYRMIPTEKYQDLIHDSSQGGYSGLSFFRKNTNIHGYNNDPTLNLINSGSDGYQWINKIDMSNRSMTPPDSHYHKISGNNIIEPGATQAISRKPIIGDQILSSAQDDAPSFNLNFSSCPEDHLLESQPKAIQARYQTVNYGKSATMNSSSVNDVDKNLQDQGELNCISTVGSTTPKRTFVASSFV